MQIKKPEIRERIREVVSSLHELDDRLAELAESLPLPPDAAEMWEFRIPTSFITNLYCALEAVRTDCLQDAVATLLHAVRQSENSLRREWILGRDQQKRRILPDHHNPGDSAGRKETPLCSG
jgi:hypothetical protein